MFCLLSPVYIFVFGDQSRVATPTVSFQTISANMEMNNAKAARDEAQLERDRAMAVLDEVQFGWT